MLMLFSILFGQGKPTQNMQEAKKQVKTNTLFYFQAYLSLSENGLVQYSLPEKL